MRVGGAWEASLANNDFSRICRERGVDELIDVGFELHQRRYACAYHMACFVSFHGDVLVVLRLQTHMGEGVLGGEEGRRLYRRSGSGRMNSPREGCRNPGQSTWNRTCSSAPRVHIDSSRGSVGVGWHDGGGGRIKLWCCRALVTIGADQARVEPSEGDALIATQLLRKSSDLDAQVVLDYEGLGKTGEAGDPDGDGLALCGAEEIAFY